MNRCSLVLILFMSALTVLGLGFATAGSPASSPGSRGQTRQAPVAPPPPSGAPTKWQLSETDHFDITYTPELEPQVERIRGRAERAYQQVSSDLRHELSLRPLLVLFSTRGELQRAISSGTVPGDREHILLSLEAPAAQVDANLVHELTHVFVFDIVPSSARSNFPRWIHEGLAEFERGEWDAADLAMLAETLRTATLPRLSTLRIGVLAGEPRLNHIVGHAAFDFLVSRAGQDIPRRFLLSLRAGSGANPTDVYLATLGLSEDGFDRGFDGYLRARFLVRP